MPTENQATPDTNQPPLQPPARTDRPWRKSPRAILPRALRIALDYLVITLGVVIFNLALDWFLIPNQIAAGGLSGIAVLLNARLGWPVGPTFLIMNIPLFVAGWRYLGRTAFALRSLYATLLVGALVDPLTLLARPATHD